MNSLATDADTRTAPPTSESPAQGNLPDYCSRALALWPRAERVRLARVRHNPGRVAALISHRTNLSRNAILELLGAPGTQATEPDRQN
jgi:hypothetical protein